MAADGLFFLVLSIQQVSYIAQFFGCVLQSFYLLSELRLLGLFFAENFVDILHEIPSLKHFTNGLPTWSMT